MQNNAFKTLKLIAKENAKKLAFTFALVLAENALFLLYPIFAGVAINALVTSKPAKIGRASCRERV